MNIPFSEFLVRFLEKLGVETIFGMPGAHILPVYDSLYDSKIQSVLAKHEQGAAFMAGGFARSSGKIGACITTAGPGATNLVTGIGSAYVDALPIIAITGEAPTYMFGKGGLQESSGEGASIDQSAIFQGISRYHKLIERIDYAVNILNQAAKILTSERPGPVVLSIPYNVQNELIDADFLDKIIIKKVPYKGSMNSDQISPIVTLLKQARNPIIVAGFGCIISNAQHEIKQLSQRYQIPVTSSLKAKGVIDEQSALSLGSLGVTSSGYAFHYIMEHADLIIFLAASFNERTSYVWQEKLLANKKIVQVDINAEQLEKVFNADVVIQADIKQTIQSLLSACQAADLVVKQPCDIRVYKQTKENNLIDTGKAIFNQKFDLVRSFYQQLSRNYPKGLSIFDDNIIFAQSFFDVSADNNFYPNSGISSLGQAIPGAIGAGFHRQDTLFAILGDGGFQMCCMEMMTAVNYNIALNVVVFNNQTMGLIRKNQHQHYKQRFIDCDFVNPNFELLAQSFGVEYEKVSSQQQCNDLFEKIDLSKGIRLIEISIDKDAYPNYTSNR